MGTTTSDQRERSLAQRHGSDGVLIDRQEHPLARRLRDVLRQGNRSSNLFVIDDEENVLQAVRAGVRLDSLYLSEGSRADDARAAADTAEVPTHTLVDTVSRDLFGGEKRSRVFALARAPRQATLNDLRERPGDIVVLDGVRLAGNIGAIIRTSCALGAAGVVLIDSGMSSILDRRLIRSSRGLLFAVPVIMSAASELQRFLRAEQIPLVTLATDGTERLEQVGRIHERVALLMGSEREGASVRMDGTARYKLAIPMTPEVESLNVSVAAALALWERRAAETSMSRA